MKKENFYFIIILFLIGVNYGYFISGVKNKEELKKANDKAAMYQALYLKANTINKFNDSLHSNGLFVNLSGLTQEKLYKLIQAHK